MIILLAAVMLVGAVAGVLAVYRYPALFPYALVTYLGWFYTVGGNFTLKFGGINVYMWDLLFVLGMLNLFIRVFLDAVPIGKEARWLILGLFAYVGWLEFSELVNFFGYENDQGFDSLIRVSISSLYPLLALSMVLSLDSRSFSRFIKYVALVAVIAALGMLIKETFNIGEPHITSSGTIRRGRGEMTVLLHIGLGILLFAKHPAPVIRYSGAGLLLIGIALLGHRSSFLGTGVLLLIFFIYVLRERVDSYKAIFWVPVNAFLGAALISFILFSNIPVVESFRTRLADTADTENVTSVDRLEKWSIAFKSVKENPLGGTRLNGLPDFYGRYLQEARFNLFGLAEAHGAYLYMLSQGNDLAAADVYPPHNVFVNILSRNGAVGLLFFLLVLLGAFLTLKYADRRARYCGVAILLANLMFLMFNNHFQSDTATALAICLIAIPIRLRMDENHEYATENKALRPAYLS